MHWLSVAKWIGMVTGVVGAMVIALNFGFVLIYGFFSTSFHPPFGAWRAGCSGDRRLALLRPSAEIAANSEMTGSPGSPLKG